MTTERNTSSETPLTIKDYASMADAIDLLNDCPESLTIIVLDKDDKVVGTLTDGDIRRWLRPNASATNTSHINLKTRVSDVMHRKPIVANPGDSWFEIISKARIEEKRRSVHIRLIPVLDYGGKLSDVLDLFVSKQRTRLEVILMGKARLENVDHKLDSGTYSKCTTHQALCERRQRYDTIRYSYELEKYSALNRIIENEFEAISAHRRLDELYTALTRGQDWARSCNPPCPKLQERLDKLCEDLEAGKRSLISRYITKTIGCKHVGKDDAANCPDIVFILGCKSKDEKISRVELCAEFISMLVEKKDKLPSAIVLSGGGFNSTTTEAMQMRGALNNAAKKRGILKVIEGLNILPEEDSLDTVGNAIFGQLALIDNKQYLPRQPANPHKKICIFTSAHHAHRTLGLFERVFHNCFVAVRYVETTKRDISESIKIAMQQLDSETKANIETFSLENAVTGMSMSITSGHVQSVFFQLMRHHKMYQDRPDLIRKYARVIRMLSCNSESHNE